MAKLAGVSVLTLRHYHSLGLLLELERVIDVLQDASIVKSLEELDTRCAALEPGAPAAKRDRILDSAAIEGLNPAQLDVIKRIEQAISVASGHIGSRWFWCRARLAGVAIQPKARNS